MKSHAIFVIVLLLFVLSCSQGSTSSDTTPPTVAITSPVSGQIVGEFVLIEVSTQDNESIEMVEFYIDDILFHFDSEEPYQFSWDTTTYEDGTQHVIRAVSYDTSENFTSSQPILLIVDNTNSVPQPIDILSVTYTFNEMTIVWEESSDIDFNHYDLLVSDGIEDEKILIDVIDDVNDTIYVLTDFNPAQPKWYWISVIDTLGYSTIGDYFYVIDENPTQVILFPIVYQDGSFHISYSHNSDNDFLSYNIYESEYEDMSNSNMIYETFDRTDTTYVLTNIEYNYIRYYIVAVNDYWGLDSSSNIEQGYSYTGIFINEFMASNDTFITDEYGDYDDWIEIYNSSDMSIDLGGFYISDDLNELDTWQIPEYDPDETTIPPGGFIILWADKETEQGILHVDIKLSSDGEDISITEPDGTTIIDSYTYEEQTTDVSEGRLPDGSDNWVNFEDPTPGESNE